MSVSDKVYDAIIIGGGPGGSSSATFLAKAGKHVLVLEKEVFPRFHIGESLLPYNQGIFAEMGVLQELEKECLVRKYGAQFHIANGEKSIGLVFKNGKYTRYTEAFQVERARFDHILLNHCASCGADVRQGWTVAKVTQSPRWISVHAEDSNGKCQEFKAQYVIDASGRSNLTGNQEGLREFHPRLRKLAIFGHFSGVKIDPGTSGGDTIVVRLVDKWFWIIPLSPGKVSVGCVMDKEEFVNAKKSPFQLFTEIWRSSAVLQERMGEATLLNEVMTTTDFSYRNRQLTGERLLRVGDAAGFMDPIFSSGIFIAMHSGQLAANTIVELLNGNRQKAQLLKRYEKRVNRAMDFYWEMVEGFYTTSFMELFMNPRDKWDLPSAVVGVLAGELEGGWKISWRMRVFFWLTRLQRFVPLAPRLTFD